MNAVKDDVIKLVHKVLESANKKFPLFHTAHEGYAVILEEVDEAEDEMRLCRANVEILWSSIRKNYGYNISYTNKVKENAINLAIEAIQVAAMAQKFMDSKKDPVAEKLSEIIEKEEKRIERI